VEEARHDATRLEQPQPIEGIEWFERVFEKPVTIIDPRQSLSNEQLVTENLMPQGFHLRHLGEETVAADIEATTLKGHAARDSANDFARLENHTGPAEFSKLQRSGQAGRTGTNDCGSLIVELRIHNEIRRAS
jgi:hypothetical protein